MSPSNSTFQVTTKTCVTTVMQHFLVTQEAASNLDYQNHKRFSLPVLYAELRRGSLFVIETSHTVVIRPQTWPLAIGQYRIFRYFFLIPHLQLFLVPN